MGFGLGDLGIGTHDIVRFSHFALKSQLLYSFSGWPPSHSLQIMHPSSVRASIFQPPSIQQEVVEWGPQMEDSLDTLRSRGGVERTCWSLTQVGLKDGLLVSVNIWQVRCNRLA
jgi:hypothetical protein